MNRRMTVLSVIAGLVATVSSGLASAHHSTAMFAWGTEKSLEGTVTKWQWTNPHTFIWVDVKGRTGPAQQFGLEGMSPSWLARRGWSGKTMATGEKVKIVYYPLRDGRPGGFFVRVTMPDGNILEALPGAGGRPPPPTVAGAK